MVYSIQAEETLFSNAVREADYCGKKKTLLSLSKLCALAADDHSNDIQGHLEGELYYMYHADMFYYTL